MEESRRTTVLEELARFPDLAQVLHDTAQQQPQPEKVYFPPELIGKMWSWTSPLPKPEEEEPAEVLEQAGPPPPQAGPPPPPIVDWPWPQPEFYDLTLDDDE